jgi:protein-disulfide isomerase
VKRFLPFLIILVVGLVTFGTALALYRQKTQPSITPPIAAPAASVATADAATPIQKEDDSKLHFRGPRDAELTVEVYGDFQCPACATASRVVDELQQQEYRDKMKVIFHEFPLAMHKHAKEAAMAAEAAGLQGKFWEMHDTLYKYQDVWSQVSNAGFFFETYAQQIGLDVEQFKTDRFSMKVQDMVYVDGNDGLARGLQNTPTIFVNGVEAKAAFTKEKLKQVIDAALASKKP